MKHILDFVNRRCKYYRIYTERILGRLEALTVECYCRAPEKSSPVPKMAGIGAAYI
jgi:hypothetical protein